MGANRALPKTWGGEWCILTLGLLLVRGQGANLPLPLASLELWPLNCRGYPVCPPSLLSSPLLQALENALRAFPSGCEDRWEKVAAAVASRSKDECVARFKVRREMVHTYTQSQACGSTLHPPTPTTTTPHTGAGGPGQGKETELLRTCIATMFLSSHVTVEVQMCG